MRATVCLPTYNERENLEPMLRALGDVLRDGRPRARDRRQLARTARASSPTGSPPSSASSTCCTARTKEGLGPAYLAGFRRALADGAELILEMDCDFSHDPADVPRLIAAAEDGADLVLGSRYVPGGRVGNWGLVRRVDLARRRRSTPRSSCRWACSDPTGGFKCFRRRVLETIDLDAITPRGYAFQIETTYRVKRAGFRVVEVPITFADRDARATRR